VISNHLPELLQGRGITVSEKQLDDYRGETDVNPLASDPTMNVSSIPLA